MVELSLTEVLDLVGDLRDKDRSQEKFRKHLEAKVKELSILRDYAEECIRNTGTQYDFALQDLLVYLGRFLGFEIEYGRYRGTQTSIGFDGRWWTPDRNFHVVIEVKKTEAYNINTTPLIGYVDKLIENRTIPSWDSALGLYVVGKFEPKLKQLESKIIAEKRTQQLRVMSADALLSLAEIRNEYDVELDDVLALIKPSGPIIDPSIDLITRVTSTVTGTERELTSEGEKGEVVPPAKDVAFWLTPVKSTEEETADECIARLVGKEKIYAFGERTPGRKNIKPGDRICFYSSGKGVVAHATVSSFPENKVDPRIKQAERYPWVFALKDARVYTDNPVVIDRSLRDRLPAFKSRDPDTTWAWFVQGTRRLSEGDFEILTRLA